MIAGDVFDGLCRVHAWYIAEAGIGIFMLIFLAVDAYLSVDYILESASAERCHCRPGSRREHGCDPPEAEDDRLEREKEQQEQELERSGQNY